MDMLSVIPRIVSMIKTGLPGRVLFIRIAMPSNQCVSSRSDSRDKPALQRKNSPLSSIFLAALSAVTKLLIAFLNNCRQAYLCLHGCSTRTRYLYGKICRTGDAASHNDVRLGEEGGDITRVHGHGYAPISLPLSRDSEACLDLLLIICTYGECSRFRGFAGAAADTLM